MAQKKKKKPQPPKNKKKRLGFSQIVYYSLGILVILSMILSGVASLF